MTLWWKKHKEMLRDSMREVSHKSSITNGLGNAIKALQLQHIDSCLVHSDNLSDNLCYYLEAIFIHGLKDNFFEKVSTILANNSDKTPEPNFWPFLLVFTHKDVLSQISKLSQIQTEVGRCRALIRLALNEGLIESYLSAMIQDKSTVKHYYKEYSYLRDAEQPDIMKKYIEGLHLFEFKLACNSRMLNVWSPTPLILSGIWSPPIVPEPVFTGIDAVSFFDVNNSTETSGGKGNIKQLANKNEAKLFDSLMHEGETSSEPVEIVSNDETSSPSSVPSCPDPMPPLLYEEALGAGEQLAADLRASELSKLSLKNDSHSGSSCATNESNLLGCGDAIELSDDSSSAAIVDVNSKEGDIGESSQYNENEFWLEGSSFGNEIIGKDSWSSSGASKDTDIVEIEAPVIDVDLHTTSEAYQELLQNYSPVRSSILRTPDFQDFIGQAFTNTQTRSPSSSSVDDSDFEILPRNCSFLSANADQVTKTFIKTIGKIANEVGLDTQNYQCKFCSSPIGLIYGKARVCNYDGFSYCQECHLNEEYHIPSRIIHNWDFKKYKVSNHTMNFFQQVEDEPLLDIRNLNSQLYSISSEMKELQMLRTQLNYLRSYLFTCRESVAEEMRRKLWPKDYLYDHIHLYSFKDLINVPSRSLAQLLQKVILFASKHVAECELCRQKGFVCEVCGSPKVIYPFELGDIYRCEVCLAVYHSSCMSSSKQCPKCERIKRREDKSDCNWS